MTWELQSQEWEGDGEQNRKNLHSCLYDLNGVWVMLQPK